MRYVMRGIFVVVQIMFLLFWSDVVLSSRAQTALHVASSPRYQNVVIFGDSQTDIGNGPESTDVFSDDTDQTLAFNLYVPISNPVNLQENLMLPDLASYLSQPRSALAYMDLPAQPLLYRKTSDPTTRQFRSLNWVGYFMQNAVEKNILPASVVLRPWVLQYPQWQNATSVQPSSYSLSYAWYSALSANVCTDFQQHNAQASCGQEAEALMTEQESSIFEKQKTYRLEQTGEVKKDAALLAQQLIPGAQKQVMMYAQDSKSFGIANDPEKTLYIVWIGANDLHQALGDHLIKQLRETIPDMIAGYHQNEPSVLDRLVNLGARHIMVVGQYNLGDTPEMVISKGTLDQQHKVANQFAKLSRWYNDALKLRVEQYSRQSVTNNNELDLSFVDIQTPLDHYVKAPDAIFYPTLGLQCDRDEGHFEQLASGAAESCVDQPIGWWNSLHLATQLNQVVASALLKQIEG